MSQAVPASVTVSIEYPEGLSRLHLLLKSFLGWAYVGIPHGIILYFYGILSYVAVLIAFLAIMFTGRYPRGLFDFVAGYMRWSTRVNAYMYYLMTDDYPPFSSGAASHSVAVEVGYPERLSRPRVLLKFFFGWLYAGIPHGIALLIYGIAVLVAVFISWWSILLLGRYPRGFFDFVEGFVRWGVRLTAYLYLMRDEYPPFSGRP